MSGSAFPVGLFTLLANHHGISQPSTTSWELASPSWCLLGHVSHAMRWPIALMSKGSEGACTPCWYCYIPTCRFHGTVCPCSSAARWRANATTKSRVRYCAAPWRPDGGDTPAPHRWWRWPCWAAYRWRGGRGAGGGGAIAGSLGGGACCAACCIRACRSAGAVAGWGAGGVAAAGAASRSACNACSKVAISRKVGREAWSKSAAQNCAGGQPLRIVRWAQRIRRLDTGVLPGHQGIINVAEQSRHGVGHAEGDRVWYTGNHGDSPSVGGVTARGLGTGFPERLFPAFLYAMDYPKFGKATAAAAHR